MSDSALDGGSPTCWDPCQDGLFSATSSDRFATMRSGD